MMLVWEHFHFLRPEWLSLLLPAVYLAWRRDRQSVTGSHNSIIAPHLRQALWLPQPRLWGVTPKLTTRLLVVCAVLVLAGPTWQQQPSPLSRDSAPLVVLLDTSASMASTDIAPSRLERAQQKIRDLLDRHPDKQVALIVFAGSAHVVLPLTSDHDILMNYLSSITSEMMPRAGKYPEYSLASIDQLTGNSSADILLVTDAIGPDSAQALAHWLDTRAHHLIILGVGASDPGMSEVPLAETALRTFSARAGADWVKVTVTREDVDQISSWLTSRFVDVNDDALPWLDAGYWLVWPGLLLLLFHFRRGWSVLSVSVVLGLFSLPVDETAAQTRNDRDVFEAGLLTADAPRPDANSRTWLDGVVGWWLTDDQYGHVLMSLGHYNKASYIFADPFWSASAAYYDEDFQRAGSLFLQIDRSAAVFNRANALAHARNYAGAAALYRQVLISEPDHTGASLNLAVIEALLDEIQATSAAQRNEENASAEDLDGAIDTLLLENDPTSDPRADRPTYSADELLASEEATALWLRAVTQEPARFLSNKFAQQLSERGVSE
jgi:Ca-activated chloride channel family protein